MELLTVPLYIVLLTCNNLAETSRVKGGKVELVNVLGTVLI